jgi:hypothetical protein
MVHVTYSNEFNYLRTARRHLFPGLTIRVQKAHGPDNTVEIEAHLDSGAEYSLFDGEIAGAIGLDLLSGGRRRYAATHGEALEARIHQVTLVHPELGSSSLPVGFSTVKIRRNLLGRDFFNLIQIGFRERQLSFYVTPTP